MAPTLVPVIRRSSPCASSAHSAGTNAQAQLSAVDAAGDDSVEQRARIQRELKALGTRQDRLIAELDSDDSDGLDPDAWRHYRAGVRQRFAQNSPPDARS